MSPRHQSDTKPGWIRREIAGIKKQIRELSAARRLESATIGKGGLTLRAPGRFKGLYDSGRTAFEFGAIADNTFGMSILKDEPDSDTKRNLFDVYRIGPSEPYFPDGANVVQSLGGDFFLARGRDGAAIDSGPPGAPAAASVTVVSDGGGVRIETNDNSPIVLASGTGGVYITHGTTGASPNCFIDPSDSRVWRSTSSRRYKQDIEDAEVDIDAVLHMQGRTWRDKGQVETNPDTEQRYVGFIAEELDEIGLQQFVVYNAEGQPDAISYDRLAVALLEVVKNQETRLRRLEALADEGA